MVIQDLSLVCEPDNPGFRTATDTSLIDEPIFPIFPNCPKLDPKPKI